MSKRAKAKQLSKESFGNVISQRRLQVIKQSLMLSKHVKMVKKRLIRFGQQGVKGAGKEPEI